MQKANPFVTPARGLRQMALWCLQASLPGWRVNCETVSERQPSSSGLLVGAWHSHSRIHTQHTQSNMTESRFIFQYVNNNDNHEGSQSYAADTSRMNTTKEGSVLKQRVPCKPIPSHAWKIPNATAAFNLILGFHHMISCKGEL